MRVSLKRFGRNVDLILRVRMIFFMIVTQISMAVVLAVVWNLFNCVVRSEISSLLQSVNECFPRTVRKGSHAACCQLKIKAGEFSQFSQLALR